MSRETLRARLIARLKKIGYPILAAELICNRLTAISSMYKKGEEALEIIVENIEKKITGPFSSQQLSVFVREINPEYTPWYLYEKILGISPDEVDCVPVEEQAEYWQEKRQLDRKLAAIRQSDLSILKNTPAWEILTRHNWRELQPSLGLYRQIKGGRPISTPLGGQPGRTRHS